MIEFQNNGKKALIKNEWKDSFLEQLLQYDIHEIELNDGKGWKGNNIDFLKHFPHLKSLIIIDLSIEDIHAVHFLSELESLELITYAKTPLDFKAFTQLKNCNFEWIKGSESLFESISLKTLFLNRWNYKKGFIHQLINLENLSLSNSSMDNLKEIDNLIDLKRLELVHLKKLNSLEEIGNFRKLEVLELYQLKNIYDVSCLFGLEQLKRLLLIDLGMIKTLKGIEELVNLEELFFYGSTNIEDGDLLPITKLEKLKNISFQNRKHYTHKRAFFGND